MTSSKGTSRFMAMKGGGYYSKATTGAKDVIDGATDLVLDAIGSMHIADDERPFSMADFGCADGGTSIDMIGTVLREMRRRAPARPLQMFYTDLPRNDFSQLFRNVHGLSDLEGYVDDIDNLHVYASATSFHHAIFPPATLDLGFSATASHYISAKPGVISNHVHMVGAQGAERNAYIEQGRKDWEGMLLNRANELVPGGKLALFNFGIDEQGRYLGSIRSVDMFDTFNAIWAELRDEGRITAQEYVDTNFPQSYRTVEQFVEPLVKESSSIYAAGLRLEHVETRVVDCPYATDFLTHRDPAKFAVEYIPTLRSWSEATFSNGLANTRPVEDRLAIIDDFYGRYESRVREAPDGHAMDYVHCYLIVRKEK